MDCHAIKSECSNVKSFSVDSSVSEVILATGLNSRQGQRPQPYRVWSLINFSVMAESFFL